MEYKKIIAGGVLAACALSVSAFAQGSQSKSREVRSSTSFASTSQAACKKAFEFAKMEAKQKCRDGIERVEYGTCHYEYNRTAETWRAHYRYNLTCKR